MDFTVVTGQAICLWKFCRGWLIKYLGLWKGELNTYTLNSTLVFSLRLRDLVDVFMFLDTHCSPHRLTDQCVYNSALRKSWLRYFLNRGFGNRFCADSYFFGKCCSRVFCFTHVQRKSYWVEKEIFSVMLTCQKYLLFASTMHIWPKEPVGFAVPTICCLFRWLDEGLFLYSSSFTAYTFLSCS